MRSLRTAFSAAATIAALSAPASHAAVPDVVVRSAPIAGSGTVACEPGEVALGGGSSVDDVAGSYLARDEPEPNVGTPSGWETWVRNRNDGAPANGTAYAVCARGVAATVRSAHFGADGDAVVSCLSGEVATGGGLGADTPAATYVARSQPEPAAGSPSGWHGWLRNRAGGTFGTGTAYAVCAEGLTVAVRSAFSFSGESTAFCLPGEVATGGGVGAETPENSYVARSLPEPAAGRPRGWGASVRSRTDGEPAAVTVRVVCAQHGPPPPAGEGPTCAEGSPPLRVDVSLGQNLRVPLARCTDPYGFPLHYEITRYPAHGDPAHGYPISLDVPGIAQHEDPYALYYPAPNLTWPHSANLAATETFSYRAVTSDGRASRELTQEIAVYQTEIKCKDQALPRDYHGTSGEVVLRCNLRHQRVNAKFDRESNCLLSAYGLRLPPGSHRTYGRWRTTDGTDAGDGRLTYEMPKGVFGRIRLAFGIYKYVGDVPFKPRYSCDPGFFDPFDWAEDGADGLSSDLGEFTVDVPIRLADVALLPLRNALNASSTGNVTMPIKSLSGTASRISSVRLTSVIRCSSCNKAAARTRVGNRRRTVLLASSRESVILPAQKKGKLQLRLSHRALEQLKKHERLDARMAIRVKAKGKTETGAFNVTLVAPHGRAR